MSTKRLINWITFLAIFAMAARISVDTDTWWHLRAGDWMLEHRQIIQTDHFSYTRAGEFWRYPGWLVQIPMTGIFNAFGPGGLNLWVAGMVTLAFFFVWKSMEGGVFLRAFALIFGAVVSGVFWAARPYMVTLLLAAVFLWILEDYRWNRKDRLLWLPFLMVFWANSHGGFAVGFLMWGIYGIGVGVDCLFGVIWGKRDENVHVGSMEWSHWGGWRGVRRMFLVGGAMLLAVMVNPAGPVMLLYPFQTVGIESLRDFIQEWQSPNFHQLHVQPFAWLLLTTLGVVGISKKGLALVDFLLVAGFAYLGLLAGRNVALFALAAPIVLARHAVVVLDQLGESVGIQFKLSVHRRPTRVQKIFNWTILVLLVLAVGLKISQIVPVEKNQEAFDDFLPVGAVDYLREEQPQGHIFNSYNWGGYLLWVLPEYPVFVDGRTDLFDGEIFAQWLTVVRAEEGWRKVLENWDIHLVLLEPDLPIIGWLEKTGWVLLYEDEFAVVYSR